MVPWFITVRYTENKILACTGTGRQGNSAKSTSLGCNFVRSESAKTSVLHGTEETNFSVKYFIF